ELGRFSEAVAPLNTSIQLARGNAEAYNELGFAYRKLGQNDSAIDIFNQSLKLDPDSAVPHFGLADTYFYNLRLYEDAIRHYRTGLSLNSNDGNALRNLGVAFNALARHAEAIDALSHAAVLLPADSKIYFEMGMAYEAVGKSRDAVSAYQ